ncbi:MAG: hypothetical protein VB078_04965 [Clostridiaceae bacterium]|nr:hypothetical protein [Clostridiaceae bacterium]
MIQGKFNAALLSFLIMGLTVTGIFASAAAYGSEDDPLVTVSYINDVVKPQITNDIDKAVTNKESELLSTIDKKISSSDAGGSSYSDEVIDEIAQRAAKLSGSTAVDSWQVIKVPAGKTLSAKVGCQILLRIGGASCVSSGTTGLINLSDATILASGGALKQNSLYMATIDGRGFKAGSDATILVKGSYSIS